jgi:enamine deaminase RidA (YjgF/YER057c/UK114 family)
MLTRWNRRGFLGSGVAAGAAAVVPGWAQTGSGASPEARLQELGITLPEAPNPVATYVTSMVSGSTLYISGHGPAPLEGVKPGKVGADLTLDEGRLAARATALAVLATMKKSLGSLDRVVQLLRTFGMVNAAPDFTQHPQVINGYSDRMAEVFGEKAGKGVRAAVGMGSLPNDIAVEIESIWEIRS